MNETKERGDSILWIEAFGFSSLIVLTWMTEVIRIPYLLFDEPFEPNWHRSALRTMDNDAARFLYAVNSKANVQSAFVQLKFNGQRCTWTGSNNLHRTFRQGVQKCLPVLLRQNPVVQNHDDVGIDLLPQKEYFFRMETVTLKMDRKHIALLKGQAKALGRSQAAVVRDLIDEHLAKKKRPSLHDLARDFCGSVSGPTDMSTRKLTGYGRD